MVSASLKPILLKINAAAPHEKLCFLTFWYLGNSYQKWLTEIFCYRYRLEYQFKSNGMISNTLQLLLNGFFDNGTLLLECWTRILKIILASDTSTSSLMHCKIRIVFLISFLVSASLHPLTQWNKQSTNTEKWRLRLSVLLNKYLLILCLLNCVVGWLRYLMKLHAGLVFCKAFFNQHNQIMKKCLKKVIK